MQCPPVMNRFVPAIYCEKCGGSANADLAVARYCVDCNLYICRGCWDSSRSRCRSCATATAARMQNQRERGVSLRTARRADFRLRQAATEAGALATSGMRTSPRASKIDAALLTIKITVAEQLGRAHCSG